MARFTASNVPTLSLIENIDMDRIGLLELQQTLIWPNINVRDLSDTLCGG